MTLTIEIPELIGSRIKDTPEGEDIALEDAAAHARQTLKGRQR